MDAGFIDAHVVEPPARLGPIHRFDEAVDHALDRFRGHEPSDRIIYAITELADFSLLWHLIGWSKALRSDRDVTAAVRLSTALAGESAFVNGVVKSLFERERPVQQVERPHRLRVPLTTSFPSGHASAAFVAASLLAQDSKFPAFWYAGGQGRLQPGARPDPPRQRRHRGRRNWVGGRASDPQSLEVVLMPGIPRPERVAPDMALTFAITWDYRCPFARNLHDNVIAGLLDGADWDVTFVPFSLGQVHVGEGETDVWDEPDTTAAFWRSAWESSYVIDSRISSW